MAHRSIVKKLSYRYLLALGIIALLGLCSQVLIHYSLKSQGADAVLINIAGRQRMLSQKLVKTALLLGPPLTAHEYSIRSEAFSQSLEEWIRAHVALQHGDEGLNIPAGATPPNILESLRELTPYHEAMVDACNLILQNPFDSKNQVAATTKAIERLMDNEQEFLFRMDNIVKQYEENAGVKLKLFKRIEISLLIITFFVLVMEAMLIFRPIIRRLSVHFAQIRQLNTRLEKVLETIPSPFITLNEANKIIYANQSFFDLFGINPNRVVNRTIDRFIPELASILPVGDHQSLQIIDDEVLAPVTLEVMCADGRKLALMVRTNAFRSGNQRWLNITFQNLTAILNSEKIIDRQHQMLKKIAWKHSHEFRKPVANILGLVQWLVSGEASSKEEQKRILEHLQTSADELDHLIFQFAKSISPHVLEEWSEKQKMR